MTPVGLETAPGGASGVLRDHGPTDPSSVEMIEMRQRGDARAFAVPHQAVSVPAVRHMVVDALSDSLDDELLHEAGVIASELLANAVRHARPREDGRMVIRWQVRAGVLDLEVTDGGSAGEIRPLRPATLSTNGRGLRIVRSLAHEWGVVQNSHGRTVWACLGGPSRRRHRG